MRKLIENSFQDVQFIFANIHVIGITYGYLLGRQINTNSE